MKHREHKCTFFLLTACLLLAGLLLLTVSASAGYNSVYVTTEGKGATVYTASSGSGKAGILYNGYQTSLDAKDVNGRYECELTYGYSVWVDLDKAESLYPQENKTNMEEWRKTRPCNVFLGEITKDNTPVYSTPKNKRETARHAKGTMVIVCGEFGKDYYVDNLVEGFIPKDAVRKVKDLNAEQANNHSNIFDDLPTQTVYASRNEPVYLSASAGGYSDEDICKCITENKEVRVVKDLGDWVQLQNLGFIEKRFLDPDAPHSYPTAWVKCDGKLDRLNVRWAPDTDSGTVVKLCSGVPVHVVAQTKDWAVVFVTGPEGGRMEHGCVMKKYLSFDGKDVKYDGRTQVRLKRDLEGYTRDGYFGLGGDDVLPEGTLLSVVGVYTAFDSTASSDGDFLCETEDGQCFKIRGEYWVEPVKTETDIYAKTRSAVRLRKSPDEDGAVLHEVKAKTKVEVLLRGEIWTIVKYKDEIGYMMSRYLSFP